jgi:hypothetical protein
VRANQRNTKKKKKKKIPFSAKSPEQRDRNQHNVCQFSMIYVIQNTLFPLSKVHQHFSN